MERSYIEVNLVNIFTIGVILLLFAALTSGIVLLYNKATGQSGGNTLANVVASAAALPNRA